MCGILAIADGLVDQFKRVLPAQRKTQRENLALLVATMPDVRSANLMDLAAGLPRAADRTRICVTMDRPVLGNPLLEGHPSRQAGMGPAIAMSAGPTYLNTLDYCSCWGIEPMFSDFKSRGFGIAQT